MSKAKKIDTPARFWGEFFCMLLAIYYRHCGFCKKVSTYNFLTNVVFGKTEILGAIHFKTRRAKYSDFFKRRT